MMTKMVPTAPTVPKLSVHWSVPWPREWERRNPKKLTLGQWRYRGYSKLYDYDECDGIPPRLEDRVEGLFGIGAFKGYEPDWHGARKIRVRAHDVRVFPHEFNPMPPESMRELINGGVLLLRKQSSTPSEIEITTELVGEPHIIYEEALVAGCDHAQAMMVAHGIDPTIPDAEFPPIGWYKCAPKFAQYFCRDWEADEDTLKVLRPAKKKKKKARKKRAGLKFKKKVTTGSN